MINKTEQIVNKLEIEQFRRPAEFIRWVELKLELFKKHREQIKNLDLLRKGISGKFWGEIYPLYLFLKKQTLINGKFKVKNILGNQPYDIKIQYLDNKTHTINKLEFTEAKDGYDLHLRMKRFVETGTVSLTGRLKRNGTEKRGHNISISEDATEHRNLLNNQLDLVKKCILNKINKYKKNQNFSDIALAIVVDDYVAPRYDSKKDLDCFNVFVNSDNIFKNTGFAALFFVGLSGGLFFEIEDNKSNYVIPRRA
jgi:hypothetical protein